MNAVLVAASVIGGYLLGAVSFARIIGRIVIPDEDLRQLEVPIEGSERMFHATSISATTIRVKAGPKYGCLTSILDMVKAFAPTLALRLLFPGQPYYLFCAASAVAGHNFPVYYGFRGGRGISPIYGGLFVIDWLAIPAATVVGGVVTTLVVRFVPLMYLGVTLMLIPWFWFRYGDWPHMLYAGVVNVCFWTASIPELREFLHHRRQGDFSGSRYLLGTGDKIDGPILKLIRRVFSRRDGGDSRDE
jgi:glycerol-3-phosphate acyltransferase PlsY